MRKLSPQALQRKRWLKALGIARILFEEDGYHTAYLDEIEAFIRQHPPPDTPHTLDEDTAARVARLLDRMGKADWRSLGPAASWDILGELYEEVRQLVATDPQAAGALLAAYAPERCAEPGARYTDAADTSAAASAKAEPPVPEESPYRIDHYPSSRFWAVYAREELVAVTVYRKGAREITDRLEAQERTIAALTRQLAAVSTPHP